jgi:hypothetical protein
MTGTSIAPQNAHANHTHVHHSKLRNCVKEGSGGQASAVSLNARRPDALSGFNLQAQTIHLTAYRLLFLDTTLAPTSRIDIQFKTLTF